MIDFRSTTILFRFLSGLVFLVSCAEKANFEESKPIPIPVEKIQKMDPLTYEVNQIDYSNRLIDAEFEEQVLSPVNKFENYLTNSSSNNQQISCKGKKIKNLLNGVWICKNISGKKVIALTFNRNKKNGWAREWDDLGNLKAESWWRNNLLSTPARTYFNNKKINIRGGFKNNLRNGAFSKYDEAGVKLGDTFYKDGKRKGLTRIFYSNGKLKSKLFYLNDQAEGKYWSWYENGTLKSHGSVKRGIPQEDWSYWSEDGKKLED